MDWDKIRKFLVELRKENGLTQQQLSEKLYTSRENISKWERGVNNPSTEMLIDLSKIYNVSVNELLAGERKTETNEEKINNMAVEVLKDSHTRIKKILTTFIIIIVAILFIFFIYYFINTYNTLYVYKIFGENDNFSSKDGIVIFSKNKSYLKLGEIVSRQDIAYDKVEFFYKTKNNKEIVIYESKGENTTLISIYGSDEYFSYKNMKEIINNSYLRLIYGDKIDIIKLKFQRDMHNSFLIFNNDKNIGKEKVDNNQESDLEKAMKYFAENFVYDEDKNSYSYDGQNNDFKYNIKFMTDTYSLVICEYRNDSIYFMEYNYYTNCLSFSVSKNDGTVDKNYNYDIENKTCLNGECDNKLTDYFLDNYLNKFSVK